MRHIIESIIGKKNNRIIKSIISDGDILETRAGVQFIYISGKTWENNVDAPPIANEVLVNVDPCFNFGWVVNKFEFWNDDLTGREKNFDIVKIYRPKENKKYAFYNAFKARDRFKRAKLLNIHKDDTLANVTPININ